EIGPTVCKLPVRDDPDSGRPSLKSGNYLRYQTNHPTYQAFPVWANLIITAAVQIERSAMAGLRLPAEAKKQFLEAMKPDSAFRPLQLQTLGLSKRDLVTGQVEDPPMVQIIARFLVPAGLVMLIDRKSR